MKCLIAKVLDDQVVLVTQDGEFRTVPRGFVLGHLPYPESEVTAGVLPAWTGRQLDLPWPPPDLLTMEGRRVRGEGQRRWWPHLSRTARAFAAAATATAAAAAVFGFVLLPRFLVNQPQAVVAIDINPSLELQVDAAGRVLRGTPLNADAKRVLDAQPVKGLALDQAVDRVIDQAVVFGYLAPGKENVILASVVPLKGGPAPDPARLQRQAASRLQAAGLSGYVAAQQVSAEVRTQGHKDRLSVNRELAREALSQKGISISTEELRSQSIPKALKAAGLDAAAAFPGGEHTDAARPQDETGDKQVQAEQNLQPGADRTASEGSKSQGSEGEKRQASDSKTPDAKALEQDKVLEQDKPPEQDKWTESDRLSEPKASEEKSSVRESEAPADAEKLAETREAPETKDASEVPEWGGD